MDQLFEGLPQSFVVIFTIFYQEYRDRLASHRSVPWLRIRTSNTGSIADGDVYLVDRESLK